MTQQSSPLQLIQSLDHYQLVFLARAVDIGATAIALTLFCAMAIAPRLPHKLAAGLTGSAVGVVAAGAHVQWRRSQRKSMVISTAADNGFDQEMVKVFMPMDARPVKERQQQQPALEAEVVEEEEFSEFELKLLEASETADPTAKAIARTLAAHGALVCPVGRQDGLAFDRYLFEPDRGVSIKKVIAATKDLQVGAGLADEPVVMAVAGAIAIDVSRPDRQFAPYDQFINGCDRPAGVAAPVGVDQLTRKLVWLDFTDPNSPHALVGGVTGGGKSELLRAMAFYLCQNYSGAECQMVLIDPKISSFGEFQDDEKVTLIEDSMKGAIAIIKMIPIMMRRRSSRKGFKDVAAYNKAHPGQEKPRILIFVEELKDLMDALEALTDAELDQMSGAASEAFESEMVVAYSGKGTRTPKTLLMMALGRLGQAGRSEGIHLVCCTQEPNKDILGDLVSNLPVKIGLRLRSHVETGIVMPGQDAYCHRLLGKGDLLLSVPGRSLQRCQGLFIEE